MTDDTEKSACVRQSQLAASPVAEIGFDLAESFEAARPVRVARSDRLGELHAAADAAFERWLQSGNPDDIRQAAALAEEARQLQENS